MKTTGFLFISPFRLCIHPYKSVPTSIRRSPASLLITYTQFYREFQAPQEYIDRYQWIKDPKRRIAAAMTTCMDHHVGRIIGALQREGSYETSLIVMSADNGGPPYVANSNWPVSILCRISTIYYHHFLTICLNADARRKMDHGKLYSCKYAII